MELTFDFDAERSFLSFNLLFPGAAFQNNSLKFSEISCGRAFGLELRL